MKKIIVRLEGGLGNQMFQYAFARNLQGRYGGKIAFDFRFPSGGEYANSSLQHFKLIQSIRDQDIKHLNIQVFLMRVWHKVIKVLTTPIASDIARRKVRAFFGCFIQESTRFEDYLYCSPFPYKYLNGNWMSQKYFANIDCTIRQDFEIRDIQSPRTREMAKQMSLQNSVCVHIRRGDYASDQWAKKLLVCNFDYYNKAINFLSEKVFNPVYYVFSNTSGDLHWIKSNYNFAVEVNYVDLNNKDYEDLYLMSICKHFIISNSTFSWWAAFLSTHSNKIVVAPERWNAGVWDMTDIYDDAWEIIKYENDLMS